jgi:hypothetical protein
MFCEQAIEVNRRYLKRLNRLGLLDFLAAILASPAGVVAPEIQHGLAEMLDDIGTIEMDVLNQRLASITIKDDMLGLSFRPASFHHHPESVGRTDGCMRNIGRNKEGFSFAHQMIDDPIALADPDFDVAFELVKEFFRIDLMEIIPRVRSFNHHDEEVASVINVAIADRRLEEMAVLLDPTAQIEG